MRAAIALPNVLPLPGFLVAALMEAYTSDAGVLCLTALDAIRKRGRADGQDPVESPVARKAAYVPIWTWNHATQRAAVSQGGAKGVGTGIAVSRRAASIGDTFFRQLPRRRGRVPQLARPPLVGSTRPVPKLGRT